MNNFDKVSGKFVYSLIQEDYGGYLAEPGENEAEHSSYYVKKKIPKDEDLFVLDKEKHKEFFNLLSRKDKELTTTKLANMCNLYILWVECIDRYFFWGEEKDFFHMLNILNENEQELEHYKYSYAGMDSWGSFTNKIDIYRYGENIYIGKNCYSGISIGNAVEKHFQPKYNHNFIQSNLEYIPWEVELL